MLALALSWLLYGTPARPILKPNLTQTGFFPMTASERFDFVPETVAGFEEAVKSAPLLVEDGRDESLLIYGSTKGELRAIELPGKALRWRTDLGGALQSTPVQTTAGEFWSLVRDEQQAYSLVKVRAGTKECTVPVLLDRLIETDNQKRPSEVLHCVTALTFDRTTGSLVFGCSMNPQAEAFGYQANRGIGGALFRLTTKNNVCPNADSVQVLRLSPQTENPRTGFNVGLWMSGASIAAVGDGTIVFSTGNGSYEPTERNFGCSVLRVDLRPSVPSVISARSHDEGGSRECEGMNIDYGSSGVSLLPMSGGTMYFLGGKDSRLRYGWVDSINDPADRGSAPFTPGIGYTQPAVWKDGGGRVFALMAGQNTFDRDKAPTYDSMSLLNVPGAQCLGFLGSSTPTAEAGSWRWLFSGPFRNVRLLLEENSEAAKALQAMYSPLTSDIRSYGHPDGLFAPFVQQGKQVGGSSRLAGHIEKDLWVTYEKQTGSVQIVVGEPPAGVRKARGGKIVVPVRGEPNCEEPPEGQVAVYRYRQLPPFDEHFPSVRTWRITAENEAQPLWSWSHARPDWFISRSSPSVGGQAHRTGGFAFVLYQARESTSSRLVALDLKNGLLVADTVFHGIAHFTRPVLWKDLVFVATRQGLRGFRMVPTKPLNLASNDWKTMAETFGEELTGPQSICLRQDLSTADLINHFTGRALVLKRTVRSGCEESNGPAVLVSHENGLDSLRGIASPGREGYLQMPHDWHARFTVAAPACEACSRIFLNPARVDRKIYDLVLQLDGRRVDPQDVPVEVSHQKDLAKELAKFRPNGRVLLQREGLGATIDTRVAAQLKKMGWVHIDWNWAGSSSERTEAPKRPEGVPVIGFSETISKIRAGYIPIGVRLDEMSEFGLPYTIALKNPGDAISDERIRKEGRYIVYSDSVRRSDQIYATVAWLKERGVTDILIFEGGVQDWFEGIKIVPWLNLWLEQRFLGRVSGE